MKSLIGILFLLFAWFILPAQEAYPVKTHDTLIGNTVVHLDSRIDTLINRVIDENDKKPTIPGYRIQIYSGKSRANANKIKATFLVNFPDESAYLIYQQPNFKIRAGNFRNQREAMPLYFKLIEMEEFKYVLLVPDKIFLPALKDKKDK